MANEKYEQQEKETASYGFKEDFTATTTDTKSDTRNNAHNNDKRIQGLPSERESRRRAWARKLEFYIDSLQETIFTATRALNDVTGYSAIQKLRQSIDALEEELDKSKAATKAAKIEYNDAISNRLTTQKEVNELLQRKASWSSSDLERFTRLYKEDHSNAVHEEEAKNRVEQAEAHQEELYDKLSNAILTRYHEEQIWSDKIRRTSTWGTFGLMGINIFLFLVFQLALEPWKRKRLVGNFEEKVQHVLEENSNQQNKRLDLMSEKMEELKNGDTFPALQESVEPEVIPDTEVLLITPPQVSILPLPDSHNWRDTCLEHLRSLLRPLAGPYALLFNEGYASTTVDKTEMATVVSITLTLGIVLGSILSSILK
ncbi:Sensitive to high expression protein 9, mitochondrial [Cyberlindnera fabianii]|uniref:Sensitive to high expression protein 9, mitochondrial n=1 Tax=Cyberlindnera fabianii TaxID=36022 RepID=A0A1V2L627_CYBFA|nr:Sensitive to high expression protein 9, mitochondrial [Cyberlindnera fabianii]